MTSNINIKLFIKKNIVNKENILEELNKMRNLITAKAGVVISEQALDVAGDVGRIMRQLNAGNTNETDVVNTIKKYKTKQDFQNFLNQYQKIVGRKFGGHLRTALDPSADSTEWNDLTNHLSTMGITLSKLYNVNDDNTTFVGLTGSQNQPISAEELQKREALWQSTFSCVTKQPGAKAYKLKDGTTTYNLGGVYYYNTGRKKLANGTMAKYDCTTEFKTGQSGNSGQKINQGPSVQTRFTQSASSLGIKDAKMTPETLQSILTTLEGGNTAPKQ
jgi:hypothetical protein